MNHKKIQILIAFLSISYTLYGDSIVIVPTHTNDNGGNIPPVLDYNLATQEFTVDFGEVDEISSGRVVIHDDSGGYQVHKWIDKRPVCLYEQPQQHKTAQDGQQIRGLIK